MGGLPDNFESMSEEEQMKWLESLAKRQGAHEGFTTEADMEVEEIDPDSVVIDEPGYTPYYESSKSSSQDTAKQPEAESTPAEPPSAQPEPEPAAMVSNEGEEDMSGLGDDPMKWLESLAKRQGAHEGFTTEADLEVEEIDPDSVVIDEPGYTPYYESSKPKQEEAASPAEEPAQSEPEPEPAVASTPPEQPPAEQPAAAVASTEGIDDADMSGMGDDPMAWLESLAKRQGAHEGFTTAADMEVEEIDPDSVVIDEPGYTPYYESSKPKQEEAAPPAEEPAKSEPEPEPEPPVEAAPAAGLQDGELPSDIDPMLWLDSLAKRQGATEGFTTTADMEIDEIDPDSVVIDEPGYTPYSATQTSSGSSQPAKQSEPEPEPISEEPERVDFDEMDAADAVEEADDDSWLSDLVVEQDGDVTDFLDEVTDDAIPGFDEDLDLDDLDLGEPAKPAAANASSEFVGMSDDEIAKAQAEGTITPEQELAWLQAKIAQAPEGDDADFDFADLDVEPATPSDDMPDWLKSQMPSEEELAAADDAEDIELPVVEKTSDEILSLVGQNDDLDLGDLDFDANTDLESLGLEVTDDTVDDLVAAATEEDSSEFDASDLLEGYTPEADEWGFALDQDLQIDDIESVPEPDWYTEAIEQADAEMDLEDGTSPLEDILEDEVAEAVQGEGSLPDWLQDMDDPTIEEADDVPDWLKPTASDAPDEIGDWLFDQETSDAEADVPAEPEPQSEPAPATSSIGLPSDERLEPAVEGAYPSWYTPPAGVEATPPPPAQPEPVAEKKTAPPPTPTPEPVQKPVEKKPEPTPEPQPELALDMSEQFQDYVNRLQRNPEDHDSRLTFAKALSRDGQINESLEQYETLIQKSAKLNDVSSELENVIKQLPSHPKARRLLGDVYMREGRLQEALDTYRGALNSI